MKVENNALVEVDYRLHEVAAEGTEILVEETTEERPMDYIHGMGILLPAFEAQLEGLGGGDAFDFVLEPDEAYGAIVPDLMMELDKALFRDSEGNFDEGFIRIGRYVPMLTADGQTVRGLVTDITDDRVMMDFNHPLSGKRLHFAGSVRSVRPATDEERRQYDRMVSGSGCCCDDGSDDCCCGHHHHHHGEGCCRDEGDHCGCH